LGERQVCHIRKNFVIHPQTCFQSFLSSKIGGKQAKALYLALKRSPVTHNA
jgi:hypothetical protein